MLLSLQLLLYVVVCLLVAGIILPVSSLQFIISTVAGNGGTTYTGPGPATSAAFGNVRAVWCDAVGNFYLSTDGGFIYSVTKAGAINAVAGGGSNRGTSPSTATAASLYNPFGLWGDSLVGAGTVSGAPPMGTSGSIFIADRNNHIVRQLQGLNMKTFAGQSGGNNTTSIFSFL